VAGIKGKTYQYTSADSVDMLQEIMGMQQKVNTVAHGTVTIESEGVDDAGNVTFLMWYDALEMKLSSMVMDTTFTNPAGLVGKKIRKSIRPNGDQVKTTEIDQLDAQLRQQMPIDKEFFLNLPEVKLRQNEAVKVTDSDTLSLMGGLMTSKSEAEYVVTGTEKRAGYNCAVVTFSGNVEIDGDANVGGMKLVIEGDGKVKGVIYFAEEQGFLVVSEQTIDMEMSATMSGPQNMTIPITQTMKSTIALIK